MKKLYHQYKVKLLFLCILTLLSTGSNIYAGFKLSTYFDIITSTDLNRAICAAVVLVLLWIFSVFMTYTVNCYRAYLIRLFNNDLRTKVLTKISQLDFEEYTGKEPGEFASWMVSDINQLEVNVLVPFFKVLESVFMACFALIALWFIHPYILAASLLSAGILAIVPKLFSNSMEKASLRMSRWNEIFSQKVFNIIAGFEVFVIENCRHLMTFKLKGVYEELESEKFKFNKKIALIEMFNTVIFRIFEMSLIILTALMAFQGIVSGGMVFAISNISNRFLNSINSLLTNLLLIRSSQALLLKFSIEEKEKRKKCPPIEQKIELKDVSIFYGHKKIIDKKNMEIRIGGKYYITGESGVGKTTLIKSILGIHDNYTGKIFFDGIDKRIYDKDSIFEHIAYISQDVYLFNDSISFNLTLGKSYPQEQIVNALKAVNLLPFLDQQKDGLNTVLGDGGKNISGGQKQRLAIAREFLQGKKIFFVDEGTSALDKKNQKMVEDLLLNNSDFTVLFISHHITAKEDTKFTEFLL